MAVLPEKRWVLRCRRNVLVVDAVRMVISKLFQIRGAVELNARPENTVLSVGWAVRKRNKYSSLSGTHDFFPVALWKHLDPWVSASRSSWHKSEGVWPRWRRTLVKRRSVGVAINRADKQTERQVESAAADVADSAACNKEWCLAPARQSTYSIKKDNNLIFISQH